MTDRPRCPMTDIVYGPCTLPVRHDGECLHQDQPRCGNVALFGGHVCVLERHHDGLHADKPLAEITPDGERMVWQRNDPDADGAAPRHANEAGLREHIRRAIREVLGDGPWDVIAERAADVVAAVLPVPADRAAVLREASIAVRRKAVHDGEDFCNGIDFAADLLCRMADEAQRPEGEARPQRVQCGDCGALGPVVVAEDGLAYLDPSGQIGHQPQSGPGSVQIFSTGPMAAEAQQDGASG